MKLFYTALCFCISLIVFNTNLKAQVGTTNGNYNFASISTTNNSHSTGFKTQQDKFAVNNGAATYTLATPFSGYQNSMYDAANTTISSTGSITIKAEGGNTCKTFTLKNINFYIYNSSNQSRSLKTMTMTIKNYSGTTIATHTFSGTYNTTNAQTLFSLTNIPFSTSFPSSGYTAVSEINFTYTCGNGASGYSPSNLFFRSIDLENISAGATEFFEDETVGTSSFTNNTIAAFAGSLTPSATFKVASLSNLGYNSSNKFIESPSANPASITSTTQFKVQSLYLYPSTDGGNTNQTAGVSVTFTGKLGGVTQFTYTPPAADFTAASWSNIVNRGFSLVNFATPGHQNTFIDELVVDIGGAGNYIAIDNFTFIPSLIVAPVITTTGSFTAFSTCAGTASAQQSFTTSGTNLTANLVVTPPAGYEVSTTSGSGFTSSVTLVPSSGTVATTTIYTRLTTTATGSPSGNIACASTGATTQNVAASGTVNAIPTITLGSNPSICKGTTSANLTYSATIGSPNQYSISWSAEAIIAGFLNVSNASLPGSPIALTAPSNPTAATYTGNLTVVNSTTGCTSSFISMSVTVNALPTATITAGGSTSLCTGGSVTLTGTTATHNNVNFNGSNLANCNNASSVQLSNGTIEAWIKTSNPGASFRGIVVKELAYGLFLVDNKIYVHNWSTGTAAYTGSVNLNDNIWHHVAFSFQSGVTNGSQVYVDGVAVGAPFTWAISAQTGNLVIGNNGTNAQHFNGEIDEVRVWNTARTALQISNNRSGIVASSASGLVAYYRFDQSSGASLTDLTGNANTGAFTASPTWQASTAPINYYSYLWSPGGATTASISATTANAYTVQVTHLGTGCSSTSAATNVTVNALPTITLGSVTSINTAATSFSLPYTATTGNPNQYSISAGTPTAMPSFSAVTNASLPASPINVTIPASAANTYNFNLTVRNSTSGCVSSTVPFTVAVNAAATAVFQPSDTIIYQGRSVQFTNSSVGLTSSSWNFGDGTFSTATSPSKVFSTAGTFNVTLSINGGASTAIKSIIVLPKLGTPYLLSDGGNFDGHNTGHFAAQTQAGTAWVNGVSSTLGKDGNRTAPWTWVTGLTGFYVENTVAYLYTPNYDLSASGSYDISFFAKFDTEPDYDGFRVEYSLDTGKVWQPLGTTIQAGWYNFANTGLDAAFPRNQAFFSGTNGSFTKYNFNISSFAGNDNVAFRFAFKSDVSVNAPGVAIDDFEITGPINTSTWTGTVWSGGTPDATKDAVINSSVVPASFTCKALTINSTFALTTTGITAIVNGNIVNNGNGIAGTGGLIVNANSTISGNAISFNGALTVNTGATLTTGGLLTLASNATNTARVANSAGVIDGNVTIQRYIPGKRAWRFLTAPLSSNGLSPVYVSNSWQGQTTIVGTSGTGLDALRPFYSMLQYNSGNWSNVSNTTTTTLFNSTATASNKAFAQFIIGDRTLSTSNPSVFNNTTLSATGKLLQGTQTFNLGSLAANAYAFVGNPYASPVDLNLVYGSAGTSNINRTFYTWDPQLGTGLNTGAYVTISWNGGGYDIVPNTSTQTQHVQSGQAFFVQATAAAATNVSFEENDKSSTNTTTVFGAGNNSIDKLFINLQKEEAGSSKTIDGVLASFGANNSKGVNWQDDAEKLLNNEEGISINRNGDAMSIERRPYVLGTNDTIFFSLNRLTPNANYTLNLQPQNWDAGMQAVLIDKLLSTETTINLQQTNQYINFTSTQANANDRFMVVFRGSGALPNRGFDVTGEKLGSNKVKINWEAKGEVGVRDYTLQKSADGVNYQNINTQAAKNGTTTSSYNYTDNNPVNGVNYYRVKTTQHNDIEIYSKVITVNLKLSTLNNVVVYPNPAASTVQISTKEARELRIINVEGKVVYSKSINTSNAITTVDVSNFGKGVYMVEVISNNGDKQVEKLVINQK